MTKFAQTYKVHLEAQAKLLEKENKLLVLLRNETISEFRQQTDTGQVQRDKFNADYLLALIYKGILCKLSCKINFLDFSAYSVNQRPAHPTGLFKLSLRSRHLLANHCF